MSFSKKNEIFFCLSFGPESWYICILLSLVYIENEETFVCSNFDEGVGVMLPPPPQKKKIGGWCVSV